MHENAKRNAALSLLASTGMWRSNYAPPLVRVLWSLGIDVPPPHFAGFLRNALFTGGFFAVMSGGLMGLLLKGPGDAVAIDALVVASTLAGLFFGLAMASYYAYGKRKHRLPSWEAFKVMP